MYVYISLDNMKPYLVSVLLIGEYILTNCSRKEQLVFALRLKIFFLQFLLRLQCWLLFVFFLS